MAQDGGLLDRAQTEAMNLAVLKRIDSEVEQVLAAAGHVVLYHMPANMLQWERKNVEGSLFLLKRRTEPRFQMMVLNKLATNNYVESIQGSLDFEVNAPYLMYTAGNGEGVIHGIWFYEQCDLDKVEGLLKRILGQLPPSEAAGPTSASGEPPSRPPMAATTDDHTTTTVFAQAAAPASSQQQQQQVGSSGDLATLLRAASQKAMQPPPQPPLGAPPGMTPAPHSLRPAPPPPLLIPPAPAFTAAPAVQQLLSPAFFNKGPMAAPSSRPLTATWSYSPHKQGAPPPPAAEQLPPLRTAASEGQGGVLLRLFAKATLAPQAAAPLRPPPSAAPSGMLKAASAPLSAPPRAVVTTVSADSRPPSRHAGAAHDDVRSERDRVRSALVGLLGIDAVVDALAAQLQAAGLLA